jgi:hypothetical protein
MQTLRFRGLCAIGTATCMWHTVVPHCAAPHTGTVHVLTVRVYAYAVYVRISVAASLIFS